MDNSDPKTGFQKVNPLPSTEQPGASLAQFLPRESIRSLSMLSEKEHEFLKSLLERLSTDLQALQGATTKEDIDRMMSTVGSELTSATKLKSLGSNEAYELVINMVSAVAASGVRCLFLALLQQSIQPKDKEK
jgi:hypothetical protein